MKKPLLLALAFAAFAAIPASAQTRAQPDTTLVAAGSQRNNEAPLSAVRAADEERVAATIAADPRRLDAIYSDQLHYAHSSGKVDDKAAYLNSLLTKATVYQAFDYKQRDFIPAGPGVVLMKGRVIVHVLSNGQKVENDLNYLAVWREENGKWRFMAWQSCRNPAPAAAKK
jgi:hypothetical protein